MSASATPTDTPLDLTEYQQRTRPLIVFVTRYLPHFRRAVFQRLIAQESHDVDLLFLHTPDVPRGETGITAPRMEKSYHVSMRHFGRYCIQPESIRQVWRLNPDVIVCEASTVALTFYVCGFLQKLRRKGVVYWTKGPSPLAQRSLRKSLGSFLFRIYSSAANVLIGYGQTSRKWFLAQGWPDDRIVVAQNSIDTSPLLTDTSRWRDEYATYRKQHEIPQDRLVIGSVSRLVDNKRIDLLVDAIGKLHRAGCDVTLLVGGDGPVIDQLRRRAAEQTGADIRFLGKLALGEDNSLLSACDICVFPGGVGLAMIQSMALAKPTVIADEPFADTELLVHEQNGLRFERGSSDDLAGQLTRLIEDNALRQQLGTAAHTHIVENATIENMVNRVAEAFRRSLELIQRKGTR